MATTNISSTDFLGFNDTTGAVQLPSGTTAERPGSPSNGEMRYNTTDNKVEYYDGTNWIQVTDYNSSGIAVDYLIVAGGGGGGLYRGGIIGGAGAGGYRTSYGVSGAACAPESVLRLNSGTTYTITVGAGGSNPNGFGPPVGDGGVSSVTGSDITDVESTGGGYAGFINVGFYNPPQVGGSGAGGGYSSNGTFQTNASGIACQGTDGRNYDNSNSKIASGGGGGAFQAATAANTSTLVESKGGAGGSTAIVSTTNATTAGVGEVIGSNLYFAGGGQGVMSSTSTWTNEGGSTGGGVGGGGNYATSGAANTGGGAGGKVASGLSSQTINGGSGVVILRMATSQYSGTTTGSPSVFTEGSDTVLVYSGSGTYTA